VDHRWALGMPFVTEKSVQASALASTHEDQGLAISTAA
jgi:hypothetical protein